MRANPLLLAALAAGGFYLMSRPSKAAAVEGLVRGKAYRAVFEMPPALVASPSLSSQLKTIMPPGSDLIVDGSRLQVKFIAQASTPIGDVPTPVGAIKLLSIEELG